MAPLDGTRVLDLTRVLAGPYCTGLLADLGADVVKVESPHGDDARHLGPFGDGESVYFAQLNRGKRSIVLDLKDPDQLARLRDLVTRADVVVENFRPGVAQRLGIDEQSLRELNPRLVCASISGFGQSGPLAQAPAYDLIAQAMSGIMHATGPEGGPPTRVGDSLGDVAAGIYTALAICAALVQRERTGRGEVIDTAMFESLVALQVTGLSILSATGAAPERVGNRHPVSTPFDTYAAQDGPVAIAVANQKVWARFAAMIDRPELVDDPRFLDDPQRTVHQAELKGIIQTWTEARTVEEVVSRAGEEGVPCSPLWDLQQALDCEQTRHRDLVGRFVAPGIGELPFVRAPFVVGGQRPVHAASPALGADQLLVDWA